MVNFKLLKNFILIGIAIFLVISIGSYGNVYGQAISAYKISVVDEPNTTDFPNVSVEFLALDDGFNNLTNLQRSDVSIKEDNQLYNASAISKNEAGVGLNLYFVIDRGNRTDPNTVRAVISRFVSKFMVDGLDRVSIISSAFTEDPLMRLHGPDSSTANLNKLVTNMPSTSLKVPLKPLEAMQAAINGIRGDALGFSRPNIIVAVVGEEVYANPSAFTRLIADAQELNTRIIIIHTLNRYFGSQLEYEKIAVETKGLYIPLRTTFSESSSDLDLNLFNALKNARYTYTATYRTKSNATGLRDLSVVIGGIETEANSAKSSYSMNLQAPVVIIDNPIDGASIVRNGLERLDSGLIAYDVSDQPVEWRIEWPDGYPRNLMSLKIVMITYTGEEEIRVLSPEEVNSTSNHLWDLRGVLPEGDNIRSLRIDVEDELGFKTSSDIVNVTVTNILPASVLSPAGRVIQWQLYALYGLLGLLLILFLIFFKKIKRAFTAGGVIGHTIENVRKTIIGGRGDRRNPIAKLEVLRPTQETKSIFTQSVKLGRDPNVSDYTFFSLNSECSVSGEHANLVKKRDGWVIIGVSASKSPVFVDGQQINLHEEVSLKHGQVVELGYEDLGSALFRFIEVAPSETPMYLQSDETSKEGEEDGYKKTQVLIRDPKSSDGQISETNVLLGELETFNDMTKDQDDFDALFEDLRGK